LSCGVTEAVTEFGVRRVWLVADNVLWIITDDQMRSMLRSMDRIWKRLVRKGVRFRRGYSAMQPLRSGDWSAWRRRLLVANPNLEWTLVREGSHAYIEHHGTGEWELCDLARGDLTQADQRESSVAENNTQSY
jgi:hypothetical protein